MTDPAKPAPDFDPGAVEATRAREQGAGLGARELNLQQDPDRDRMSDLQDPPAGGGDDALIDRDVAVLGDDEAADDGDDEGPAAA